MTATSPIQSPSFNGFARQKSYVLIQEIRVVTALPASPEPGVTYLVGAQNTIPVTGLNGNTMQSLSLSCDIINPGVSDSVTLRFNGVSSSVYDCRYSYAGSTSTTALNAQSYMAVCPTSGSGSMNHLNLNIDMLTGTNRHYAGLVSQGGASQQTVAGMLLCGGVWRDNSTNITSMTLGYASITGGFGVGSVIRIFALQ